MMRFGLVPPAEDEHTRAQLQAACDALAYHLGTTVTGSLVASYPELLKLFVYNQIDIAWLPPVVAMDADAANIARPLLATLRRGAASYYSALFSHCDSPIKTIADLVDARAAWVLKDSAAGYLVPLASLRARGLSLARAFHEQSFVGSHAKVAQHVLEGKADVGATFAHFHSVEDKALASAGWTEAGLSSEQFHIIAVAGPIPTDVIAVHRTLSPEHGHAIAWAFEQVVQRPEGEPLRALLSCQGFRPSGPAHLTALRMLIRLLDRTSSVP
jgi:phosphonate transport system substrate-binding protein